jgi:hypothetical protein
VSGSGAAAAGLHAEVLLALGYAGFLLLAAAGLDRLGSLSARRAEAFEVGGFSYHHEIDVWECPAGERLRLELVDHARRVRSYRAAADSCNRCQFKPACTGGDDGRVLHRPEDSWPHNEAGRFQRGIGLVLIVLAAFVLAVGLARHHEPVAAAVLAPALAVVLFVAARTLAGLRSSAQRRSIDPRTGARVDPWMGGSAPS